MAAVLIVVILACATWEQPITLEVNDVTVEDTTPPEIELLNEDTIVLEVEKEITIEEIATASDLSGEVTLSFTDITYETETPGTLYFEEIGDYINTILATDLSGNETEVEFTILGN